MWNGWGNLAGIGTCCAEVKQLFFEFFLVLARRDFDKFSKTFVSESIEKQTEEILKDEWFNEGESQDG